MLGVSLNNICCLSAGYVGARPPRLGPPAALWDRSVKATGCEAHRASIDVRTFPIDGRSTLRHSGLEDIGLEVHVTGEAHGAD